MSEQVIRLRRSQLDDIEGLRSMCADAFPDSLRWHGPRPIGHRWWRGVIQGSASELWVAVAENAIAGLAHLVVDAREWEREASSRRSGLILQASAVLCCPRIVLKRIFGPPRHENSIDANTALQDAQAVFAREEKTWIELIAVSSRHQRRGVGKLLIDKLEQRTRTLGKHAIGLRVATENHIARALYEKVGYRLTGGAGDALTYEKVIDSNTTP